MQIKIKQTNLKITPDIAEYLDKKLQAFDKVIDPSDTTALCEVEMGKTTHHQTGDIFFAEINITVGGKQFRAVAEESAPAIAIDKAKDELLLELGKDKKKTQTLSRHTGVAIKAMQRGIEFAGELPRRSVKLAEWGRKEFRGYWPFRNKDES